MPTTKSAKKRLRQNLAARARNRSRRSAVRTQIKKVRSAIQAGNVEAAETEFRAVQKKLDQAGASRLIHPNAAARLKSRLSEKIKALKQGAAAS